MSRDLALRITQKYLEYIQKHFKDHENFLIYFGTGEPLLNWPVIKEVSDYIRQKSQNLRMSFMTNGSLITSEIVQYLKKYKIDVGLSIDGNRETQNFNRPIIGSKKIDTYQVVIDALELGEKIGYTFYSLSATFYKSGFFSDALHVLSLCEKYGIHEFALDFDILGLTFENYKAVADDLIALYRYAIQKKISVFGY